MLSPAGEMPGWVTAILLCRKWESRDAERAWVLGGPHPGATETGSPKAACQGFPPTSSLLSCWAVLSGTSSQKHLHGYRYEAVWQAASPAIKGVIDRVVQ